ncbi:C40 family peptidase [Actinomadura flavalba]|uniref:C40 family peptidase n=1 Tax=Actinomadura flavalba TaxID=1120938 RepID=UPI0003651669|nr:C40 family peptidase [Actinomadura flavalba]
MPKPDRRILPTLIGVTVLATLGTNVAALALRDDGSAPGSGLTATPPRDAQKQADFVATSGTRVPTTAAVAPLGKRLTPHYLVAAEAALPPETVEKVRKTKTVRGAEVVDAVQVQVAGKRIGLLGVEPSTFRNFTPEPTAKSDALWRNIAAGDAAISFTMGSDGGVRLGSQIPVGGKTASGRVRVGAYATMGLGDVDAVVSRATARSLGVPAGNAVLVSAPKAKPQAFLKTLKKMLPKGAKAVEVNPAIDYPRSQTGAPQSSANGQVMTAGQVQTVIKAAYTRIGWPYVWGGESEAEGGYDCSGLMQYAFAQAGIRLPRVAADQARTGWIVPLDKAQPGDMLLWANDPTAPGYISHIALYIGDGKMIAAPRRGTRVQVQAVYTNNFKGAVRVNPRRAAVTPG